MHLLPSEFGWLLLFWAGGDPRLTRFSLGYRTQQAAATFARRLQATPADPPPAIRELAERLRNFAAGQADDFLDVHLDLGPLTDFQARVIRHCRRIPQGQTLTYGELAARAGAPGAARAVGSVMAKNRFPIIIPCHRVVGAAGSLGGFSAPDGVDMKRRMLNRECGR